MPKRSTVLLLMLLALVIISGWANCLSIHAQAPVLAGNGQPLVVKGSWQPQNYDLVYTVAVSSQQQPNGPLEVYRTSAADQHTTVQIATVERNRYATTPQFFPSADGQYLALLTPLYNAPDNAALSVVSTESGAQALLLGRDAAAADRPVWLANGQGLYYHRVVEPGIQGAGIKSHKPASAYDEISRVDMRGHMHTLLHRTQDGSSLRLVGLDNTGALIMTWARAGKPVALVRVPTGGNKTSHSSKLHILATLPRDILPGNVLRIGSDGASVECERVQKWKPLIYTTVSINFANGVVAQVAPAIDTSKPAPRVIALNQSADGKIAVTAQVLSIRKDLSAQGIRNVPAREALVLTNKNTGATQQLTLRPGEQIVQTFWTRHIAAAQLPHAPMKVSVNFPIIPSAVLPDTGRNADPKQQDEWMLEAHAGILSDSPALPGMCYGTCPKGFVGVPHVSAAVLHGVAFTESGWHQFNTGNCCVAGEATGTTVQSFDGGWGEFQQTWAMPPQCYSAGNCRSDASRIQNSQSYNIGTGAQALINAWNSSPGVSSKNATNDPYKANHWFFAVWAYNGSYGNNPNDVASSVYGNWYPGASFRSIYEETVWYYAAHPQSTTDNYLPGLGSGLLPPQGDFANTADSFASCGTCYIPDWTSAGYDRDWVGANASAQVAAAFKVAFKQNGGEDVVGLPRDNSGGAGVHQSGAGLLQDFGGGAFQPGALLLADGTSTVYWLFGGVWARYANVDRGTGGCHGYPTSALNPYKAAHRGNDTYSRQNFKRGYIVWDGTKKTITADTCG